MSPDAADLPRSVDRLVSALVGVTVRGRPTLVVGRAPEGWPSSMIPPAPVTTLGGFSSGQYLTAVFDYPSATERPVAEYCTLLESDGWALPNGPPGGGVESVGVAMMCRDSSLAQVRVVTSDDEGTSVLVSIGRCDGWPCRGDARRPHFDTIAIPWLRAPVGVRWDSGGGSSGAGDHTTRHIRVTTDLTPGDLTAVYAGQLADAGWSLGAVQVTSGNAVQWIEATDDKGRVWRGLLAVYENASVRDVFVYVATTEPGARREPWR